MFVSEGFQIQFVLLQKYFVSRLYVPKTSWSAWAAEGHTTHCTSHCQDVNRKMFSCPRVHLLHNKCEFDNI